MKRFSTLLLIAAMFTTLSANAFWPFKRAAPPPPPVVHPLPIAAQAMQYVGHMLKEAEAPLLIGGMIIAIVMADGLWAWMEPPGWAADE